MAWEELIQSYRPYIASIIRSMNVEHSAIDDVLQLVLLQLWSSLEDYQTQEGAKFRHWLATLTRRKVIDHIRHQVSQQKKIAGLALEKSLDPQSNMSPSEIEGWIESEWEKFTFSKAMEVIRSHFSDQALEAFRLLGKGCDVKEVAAKLGVKADSVYKYSARIKKRLSAEIQLIQQELDF
jgi:RNA polymerase sigma factor (sigma-70 family)